MTNRQLLGRVSLAERWIPPTTVHRRSWPASRVTSSSSRARQGQSARSQSAGPTSQWLDDPATRHAYLTHFADQESRVYMHRFYAKYRGKTPDAALATLLSGVRKSPPKVATVLRSVAPDEPQAWFDAQIRAALKRTPAAGLSSDDLSKLYMNYSIGKFDLNDRGYIASIHPLELWTVNYLRDHPLATEIQLQDASRAVRFTAY